MVTPTKQEVMTYFRQGDEREVVTLPKITDITYNLKQATIKEHKDHSIETFLARPIDIIVDNLGQPTQLLWSSSQGRNTELVEGGISFPDVFLRNGMTAQKLAGFLGLRANLHIKVMINNQKYQQGILGIRYVPNSINIPERLAMINNVQSKSSCSGFATFNCEHSTALDVSMPYVNQHIYYNIPTNQGNFGTFFVFVLSPLKVNGEALTTVNVRIQAWLEGLDVEFPTAAPAAIGVMQAAREESDMHSHVISAGQGSNLSKITDDVLNFEPKVSWLAQTSANLLKMAGWSKPNNETPPCRTQLTTASQMPNFNGESTATNLALSATNFLVPMQNAASSSMDEMLISTIVKKPTVYDFFEWTTNDPTGKILWTDNVHPMKFVYDSPGVFNPTLLGYVSQTASLWTGGINYTFQFAKTIFHSGTVRVTFIPGLYATSFTSGVYPPNVLPAGAIQRSYDLKDTAEFTFKVDYAATRPFLYCTNPAENTSIQLQNYSTGVIVVDAFIELREPTGLANEAIECMVTISAADDFKLACPTFPRLFPVRVPPGVMQSATDATIPVEKQQEGVDPTSITMRDGNSDLIIDGLCTGEALTSVRQLIKRYGKFSTANLAVNAHAIVLNPYDWQKPLTTINADQQIDFDYLDYFSYLYAFFRGSMRFNMLPFGSTSINTNNLNVVSRMVNSFSNITPQTLARTQVVTDAYHDAALFSHGPSSTSISRLGLDGVTQLQIPFYSATHMCPVLVKENGVAQMQESNYPLPLVIARYVNNNISSFDVDIFRSSGDDFSFHYIIGCPQLAYLASPTLPTQISLQASNLFDAEAIYDKAANTLVIDGLIIPSGANVITRSIITLRSSTSMIPLPVGALVNFSQVADEWIVSYTAPSGTLVSAPIAQHDEIVVTTPTPSLFVGFTPNGVFSPPLSFTYGTYSAQSCTVQNDLLVLGTLGTLTYDAPFVLPYPVLAQGINGDSYVMLATGTTVLPTYISVGRVSFKVGGLEYELLHNTTQTYKLVNGANDILIGSFTI